MDYWTPVREVIYFKRAVYARALDRAGSARVPGRSARAARWSAQEKNLRNVLERRSRAPRCAVNPAQNGFSTASSTIAIRSKLGASLKSLNQRSE